MKFATTALAIVLLAQAAPALAQRDEIERPEAVEAPRAERSYEAPTSIQPRDSSRDEGFRNGGSRNDGEGRRGRDAPTPPMASDAPQAPAAPQAREGGGRGRGGWVPGDSVGRPGPWTPNTGRGDNPRDQGGPRADDRRGDGDQASDNRSDRRGDTRGDGRGTRNRDGDRDSWRGDGRRDWDRGDNDRRDWNRRDRDNRYTHWQRGRYPSVYFSSSRYRHAWRPPSGYYAYNWGFGDFLPRTWFGTGAWMIDPWQYDLPLPPPGYDWVRAGYDALLVDAYSGRVVQVVRNVFW